MAFKMEEIKVVPVYDEDDMVSIEDLPYSKDDFLQLLETEQFQNNVTVIICSLHYQSILSETIVPMLSQLICIVGRM